MSGPGSDEESGRLPADFRRQCVEVVSAASEVDGLPRQTELGKQQPEDALRYTFNFSASPGGADPTHLSVPFSGPSWLVVSWSGTLVGRRVQMTDLKTLDVSLATVVFIHLLVYCHDSTDADHNFQPRFYYGYIQS